MRPRCDGEGVAVTARPIRWIKRKKILETVGRTAKGDVERTVEKLIIDEKGKKFYDCDSEKITIFLQRFINQ